MTAALSVRDTYMPSERLLTVLQTQNEIVATRLDLEAVMQLVAERAAQMTAADAGVVEIPDGDEMVYRAVSGRAAGHLGLRLRIDGSLSGRALREAAVLSCEDAGRDPRVDAQACRRVGAIAMVCVPLRHRGAVEGVLKVYAARPSAFDDEDVAVLDHLSSVIASHMHHAAEFQRVDHESRLNRDHAIAGLRALAHRRGRALARAGRLGPLAPRAPRRPRVPGRPARRGDPRGRRDHRPGRQLGRHDREPPLQPAQVPRGGARRVPQARRTAVPRRPRGRAGRDRRPRRRAAGAAPSPAFPCVEVQEPGRRQ